MLRPSLTTGFLVALAASGWSQSLGTTSTVQANLTDVDRMEVPAAVHRATATGALPTTTPLNLSISLAPADPAGLEAYANSVSDPTSPNYRKYLTPAEIGQRFGVSRARLDAIETYLKVQGMTISLESANHLSILVQTTAAKAQQAFDVRLAKFHAVPLADTDNSDFYSYTETPKLPSSFASSVIHIGGLENSTKPAPRMALTPDQTRSLYKASALYTGLVQGQGRNVAISNFDGYRLTNVPLYYSKYALPTPVGGVGSNIKVVTVGTGAGSGTAQGEGDLDIQMVLGMAPLCNFTIYDSTNDLIGVLTQEVNDNTADIISESYGWSLPASMATAAHNLHLSMTAQGITYLAASGDSGTKLEPYSYPDYEPEVLQVGGTIATVDANGNRTAEVGWSGSGGGYSTNTAAFNVLPSWQKGTGVPTTINKRLVPDVSLHASGGNSGAYPFYKNGTLTTGYVGTSFASPVLAGMLALAEQKLDGLGYFGTGTKRFGRLQDLIYAQNGRSDVWTDITVGTNGTLPDGTTASVATAGWDTVTGWGAMNVSGFVSVLASSIIPPNTYFPTSAGIYAGQGTATSGDLISFRYDDDVDYSVTSARVTGTGYAAAAQTSFALPAGKTGKATVTLVVNGPAGAKVQFLAYSKVLNAYQSLLSSTLTGSDQTFTISVNDVSRYLAADGTLNAAVRATNTGTAGSFTLKIDQLRLTTP